MDARRVTRQTILPPTEALAALVAETREWRESTIPPTLRAEGILRVVGRYRQSRFEWSIYGGEPKGGSVRLRGEVLIAPDGALIKAQVCRATRLWPFAAIMGAFAALDAIGRDYSSAAIFACIGIAVLFAAWALADWIPSWTASRADYLLERLEHAVAVAETAVPVLSTRPANER